MAYSFKTTVVPLTTLNTWKRNHRQRGTNQQAKNAPDAMTITSVNPFVLKGNACALKPTVKPLQLDSKLPKQLVDPPRQTHVNLGHSAEPKISLNDHMKFNSPSKPVIRDNDFKPATQMSTASSSQVQSHHFSHYSKLHSTHNDNGLHLKTNSRLTSRMIELKNRYALPVSSSSAQDNAHTLNKGASLPSSDVEHSFNLSTLASVGKDALNIQRVNRQVKLSKQKRPELSAVSETVSKWTTGQSPSANGISVKLNFSEDRQIVRKGPAECSVLSSSREYQLRKVTFQGSKGLCSLQKETQPSRQLVEASCDLKSSNTTVYKNKSSVFKKSLLEYSETPKDVLSSRHSKETHWINPVGAEQEISQSTQIRCEQERHHNSTDNQAFFSDGGKTPLGNCRSNMNIVSNHVATSIPALTPYTQKHMGNSKRDADEGKRTNSRQCQSENIGKLPTQSVVMNSASTNASASKTNNFLQDESNKCKVFADGRKECGIASRVDITKESMSIGITRQDSISHVSDESQSNVQDAVFRVSSAMPCSKSHSSDINNITKCNPRSKLSLNESHSGEKPTVVKDNLQNVTTYHTSLKRCKGLENTESTLTTVTNQKKCVSESAKRNTKILISSDSMDLVNVSEGHSMPAGTSFYNTRSAQNRHTSVARGVYEAIAENEHDHLHTEIVKTKGESVEEKTNNMPSSFVQTANGKSFSVTKKTTFLDKMKISACSIPKDNDNTNVYHLNDESCVKGKTNGGNIIAIHTDKNDVCANLKTMNHILDHTVQNRKVYNITQIESTVKTITSEQNTPEDASGNDDIGTSKHEQVPVDSKSPTKTSSICTNSCRISESANEIESKSGCSKQMGKLTTAMQSTSRQLEQEQRLEAEKDKAKKGVTGSAESSSTAKESAPTDSVDTGNRHSHNRDADDRIMIPSADKTVSTNYVQKHWTQKKPATASREVSKPALCDNKSVDDKNKTEEYTANTHSVVDDNTSEKSSSITGFAKPVYKRDASVNDGYPDNLGNTSEKSSSNTCFAGLAHTRDASLNDEDLDKVNNTPEKSSGNAGFGGLVHKRDASLNDRGPDNVANTSKQSSSIAGGFPNPIHKRDSSATDGDSDNVNKTSEQSSSNKGFAFPVRKRDASANDRDPDNVNDSIPSMRTDEIGNNTNAGDSNDTSTNSTICRNIKSVWAKDLCTDGASDEVANCSIDDELDVRSNALSRCKTFTNIDNTPSHLATMENLKGNGHQIDDIPNYDSRKEHSACVASQEDSSIIHPNYQETTTNPDSRQIPIKAEPDSLSGNLLEERDKKQNPPSANEPGERSTMKDSKDELTGVSNNDLEQSPATECKPTFSVADSAVSMENPNTETKSENSDHARRLESKSNQMSRAQNETSKPEQSREPKVSKSHNGMEPKNASSSHSPTLSNETRCQSSIRKAHTVYSQKLKRSTSKVNTKTAPKVTPKPETMERTAAPSDVRVQSAQAHVFRRTAKFAARVNQQRSKSVMDMTDSNKMKTARQQKEEQSLESDDDRVLNEKQMRWLSSLWSQCVAKNTPDKLKHVMKRLSFAQRQQLTERMPSANPMLFLSCQLGSLQMVDYLLDECGADIEKEGSIHEEETDSTYRTSPLWCAASAGHAEIVKSLIRHGSDLQHGAKAQGSSPLLAACATQRVEVVKTLIQAGADIHAKCFRGTTGLMKAVSCPDLARTLLRKGARPNEEDSLGNTALHYAARGGHVESLDLLIQYGGDCRHGNRYGHSVLQCAALRGLHHTVNYIVNSTRFFKFIEVIEAYELLGCGLVDEHGAYLAGIEQWRKATALRNTTAPKSNLRQERIAAFNRKLEFTTLAELDKIATDLHETKLQSLLIRERICGRNNMAVICAIVSSGGRFLREMMYKPCLELWKYALQLCISTLHPLSTDLVYITYMIVRLFLNVSLSENNSAGRQEVRVSDTLDVLKLVVKHLDLAKAALKACLTDHNHNHHHSEQCPCPACDVTGTVYPSSFRCPCPRHVNKGPEETYLRAMVLALHLVRTVATFQELDADQLHAFRCLVYRLVKSDHRSAKGGDSLLHLCFPLCSIEDGEDSHRSPSLPLLQTLLACGADADVANEAGETPLFSVVNPPLSPPRSSPENFALASREILSDSPDRDSWIRLLIQHKAHVDRVSWSEPRTDLLSFLKRDCDHFVLLEHVNLQCMAARAVRDYGIPYDDPTLLASELIGFVSYH